MASARSVRSCARITVALVPALVTALAAACTAGDGSSGDRPVAGRSMLQSAYERVIRNVLPSVVEIQSGPLTGSGVVFDTRGDIVTNARVVGTASRFEVRAPAASRPLAAHLVGVFAPDDLAVIRVTGNVSSVLRPARWANSAKAQVGQIVLAMGSPYGLIDSVTQGIVSGTGRTVTGAPEPGKPPAVLSDGIQTSAAINPGNSGGALVLLSGDVLGIPTLTARDPRLGSATQGIGFAIPANTVRDIAGQLIASGKVIRSDRTSLQITGRTHTNAGGQADGVTVDATAPGGAAATAGIRAGDVIVGLGGQQTPALGRLEDELTRYRPGDRVKVEVLRDGNPRQLTVTLGSLGG